MGADGCEIVSLLQVASSGAATSNIAALEAGALALRIMKNSS
jgi:hypothetical protein